MSLFPSWQKLWEESLLQFVISCSSIRRIPETAYKTGNVLSMLNVLNLFASLSGHESAQSMAFSESHQRAPVNCTTYVDFLASFHYDERRNQFCNRQTVLISTIITFDSMSFWNLKNQLNCELQPLLKPLLHDTDIWTRVLLHSPLYLITLFAEPHIKRELLPHYNWSNSLMIS